MSDLKQRLDAVEHLPVDDLWPEIRERYEDKAAGKVTSLRIAEKRRGPEVGWRKGLTIAAVFVLLAAVGIVLVRSLTSETIPANPPDEPAPPPLSGPLAYWDMQAGQVYVADLDGSNAVAIADVGAIDDECPGDVHTVAPSWSPDGRYLAFRRSSGCSARDDVVIADLQGNVVGAFSTQKKYSPYEIGWSPDSTRVAVWDEYRWREGTYTIGIYAIDGTLEAAIEMPSGWEPSWPAHPIIWTPDDASLIVSQLEVPLDGGTPREIPFHGAFSDRFGGYWGAALAYSPDGSQMAYGTPEGLMVARADGSDPRWVSADGAHTAAWSPNGELIAVASATPGRPEGWEEGWRYEQSPNRLRVVDVATGSTTTLLSDDGWLEVIGFSPDGDRVLFSAQRDVAEQPGTVLQSLWSIGVDGSDPRQIAVGTNYGVLRAT